jgi:hypothetical protein
MFVSVKWATFMDIVTPPELENFFGIQTPDPGITRIHCPLLAFFGTNSDIGNEVLESSIKRQHRVPDA